MRTLIKVAITMIAHLFLVDIIVMIQELYRMGDIVFHFNHDLLARKMAPICVKSCVKHQEGLIRANESNPYRVHYIENSFLSLMQKIINLSDNDTDAIMFTMNSAIPAADAVRGYYKSIERPTPKLYPIMGSKEYRKYFDAIDNDPKIIKQKNIVIIDNCCVSGLTIHRAEQRCILKGAKSVLTSGRTKWWNYYLGDESLPNAEFTGSFDECPETNKYYYDSRKNYVLQNMSSPACKELMYFIGRKSAEFLQNAENQEWLTPFAKKLKWSDEV